MRGVLYAAILVLCWFRIFDEPLFSFFRVFCLRGSCSFHLNFCCCSFMMYKKKLLFLSTRSIRIFFLHFLSLLIRTFYNNNIWCYQWYFFCVFSCLMMMANIFLHSKVVGGGQYWWIILNAWWVCWKRFNFSIRSFLCVGAIWCDINGREKSFAWSNFTCPPVFFWSICNCNNVAPSEVQLTALLRRKVI